MSEPGLVGIEVVECSPPYDWAEQSALISSRVIMDSLAVLIRAGKLGASPRPRNAKPGDRTRVDAGDVPDTGGLTGEETARGACRQQAGPAPRAGRYRTGPSPHRQRLNGRV
ncbi:hypothetical protein JOF55_004867 [Haloactinomyces albus]|uniref:Arginase family protein n=1 Tax=Haloactinomyces albus TaxID=1352928 RepID=A0AAE3ZGR2_9ACTN|nr:hypothetical protein [Haloactinomyces albus]MDR7304623.1 hypothetical protein [Haloactinomyces albus]